MSKIINAKGRKDGNSGYVRVLGNMALGKLLSRVQSTVISNGTELEKMIIARSRLIDDIDIFIRNAEIGVITNGVYLCLKKIFKKSQNYAHLVKGMEPDMLVFIVESRRICKIIELKDGDSFDTKKSKGEKENLEKFANLFGAKIPFSTEYYICSFNQNDKEKIFQGFKGVFSYENILTGRELCDILKIDYDEIVEIRERDGRENFEYFIAEMINIPEVKREIGKYF